MFLCKYQHRNSLSLTYVTNPDVNIYLIRQAINMFDWDKALVNLNEKVFICKILHTILNMVSIFIPLETLIIMIQTFHDLQQIQKKIH